MKREWECENLNNFGEIEKMIPHCSRVNTNMTALDGLEESMSICQWTSGRSQSNRIDQLEGSYLYDAVVEVCLLLLEIWAVA